jgi:hypothetical protein
MFGKKDAKSSAVQTSEDARPKAAASGTGAPAIHLATTNQKVFLFVLLAILTLIVVCVGQTAISRVEEYLQRENRVDWVAPPDIGIKPGPVSFWYDPATRQLVHIGVIDQKRKLELIELFPSEAVQAAGQHAKSYLAAIDKLAFLSNEHLSGLLVALLFLGGMSGVLGVQLRSLVNFVGHACYTNSLDLVTWWPYYAVRPFIGFVLGVVVVVIIHAGFFVANGAAPSGTLWWGGIAFLSGFGEQEFTQKLRQLTKTLFGEVK